MLAFLFAGAREMGEGRKQTTKTKKKENATESEPMLGIEDVDESDENRD
jgi:hypothetical protein